MCGAVGSVQPAWKVRASFKNFLLKLMYHCIVKSEMKLSCYRRAGVKGEMRYSSYSFLTSALLWGEFSASLPGHTLPP
jgi:hypothetical protein